MGKKINPSVFWILVQGNLVLGAHLQNLYFFVLELELKEYGENSDLAEKICTVVLKNGIY